MEGKSSLKISIITINYNNREGLKKTVESVVNQTYNDMEYIIIDGVSTDGSKEYIERNSDHFNYWVSEPDKGIYNAMNKGIDKATGKYLLFLNSGDVFYEKNILQKVSQLIDGTKDIYYGNEMKANGRIWEMPKELRLSYMFESSLRHQATFIKKSLFNSVGSYDENIKIVADWDFMIKAIFLKGASHEFMHLIISKYEGEGISQRSENLELRSEERKKQLQKHFPIVYQDLYDFINYKRIANNPRVQLLWNTEKYKLLRGLNLIYLRILNLFI